VVIPVEEKRRSAFGEERNEEKWKVNEVEKIAHQFRSKRIQNVVSDED